MNVKATNTNNVSIHISSKDIKFVVLIGIVIGISMWYINYVGDSCHYKACSVESWSSCYVICVVSVDAFGILCHSQVYVLKSIYYMTWRAG